MLPVLVVNEMCQTRRGDLLHSFRALQLPAFFAFPFNFLICNFFFHSQTKFCNALTSAVCLTNTATKELKWALQPRQNRA